MSYSILRNEKHKRSNASKSYMHNERKNKNYSNTNIDLSKSYLNYHLKKPLGRYEKEFDRLKDENHLKGQIKDTSVIVCELLMTSDKEFFDSIGENETKRYFEECYNFVAQYKNLGKENIISAVVHMDEATPHMHLSFIPVVDSFDKNGNRIRKVCASDYWKGKNSYGNMQDAFNKYVNDKGFKLERGESSDRKHLSTEEYKKLTNFEDTQKTLNDITLDLPNVPNIKDVKARFFNRDEQIQKEIIEPKDKLIEQLYADNVKLHKELNKQTHLVDMASQYKKENSYLWNENNKLNKKCSDIQFESSYKIEQIEIKFRKELNFFKTRTNQLEKALKEWSEAIQLFAIFICKIVGVPFTDTLIKEFEKKHGICFDFEKQMKKLDKSKRKDDRKL